jgi:cation diffusion facilitator family transporter
MTDVWTSGGVLLGVGAVVLTGWQILDPLIALAVAVQIVYSGVKLVRQAVLGLMDTALPPEKLARVTAVLTRYHDEQGITHHALRTREAGAQSFVSVHVQVPGDWSVQKGHTLLEALEHDLRSAVPQTSVFTHLEPIEDPVSWEDIELQRGDQ